jgi:predicted Zn-dependent peptidase
MPNDVRLLTAHQPDAASATALVMFGVGSRFEQAHQCGIAHFAEHMFFKGTERRPTPRDIAVEIDGIGGEFNAFTSKEYTGYYVKCASEHLELAIDVLSDQLLHSRFAEDEIEREKGVVLEELNMYRDTPARYISTVYDAMMFGDQPLGWDVIGTEEVIRGANRDLFRSFTERWYTGNRCVVGLGGRISESARETARRVFADIGASNDGTRPDVEWEQSGPRVHVHHKACEQAHIAVGLRAPGFLDEDRYAINVLNAILGGGMSSRLFLEVRERLGLCYYVHSYHDSYTDTGSLVVQAGVDTSRIDLAVTTIVNELWKVLGEPPDEAEFRKAKNYLKGRFVLGVEDPRGLVMFGVRREAIDEGAIEPAQQLAAIEAVTLDDVQRVARSLLNPDMLNLAVVGPFEDPERFQPLLNPATAVA